MMKNPGFRQEEEKGSGEDRKGRRKLCRGGEDKVFSFWSGIIAVPPEERPNGRFVQRLLSQKSLSAQATRGGSACNGFGRTVSEGLF